MTALDSFSIRSFADVGAAQWDAWLTELGESSCIHSSRMIRYFSAFNEQTPTLDSFAVFDSSAQLIALCPVSVHHTTWNGAAIVEATFSGTPCSYPVLRRASANERRRMARDVFEILDAYCKQRSVQRIVLRRPAVSSLALTDPRPVFALEALDNGYVGFARPILVMDLRHSEEDLFSRLTTEQRKHIRQSIKKGLTVKASRIDSPGLSPDILGRQFQDYRQAHFKSAGRNTRPEATWSQMLEGLKSGEATLFIAYVAEAPASYLYCGEFNRQALGWSQVNVEEYERTYSPRHYLEWSAIAHYRQREFAFYEIGERYKHPSLIHIPNEKESTIGTFKERYGAETWPDYLFEKYFDVELQEVVYAQRLKDFIAAKKAQANQPLIDSHATA